MSGKGCLTLYLLLTNALAISSKDYDKEKNGYHKSYKYEGRKPPVTRLGFFEIINSSLINYNEGKVSSKVFRKFAVGLEEYFALKLYEKKCCEIISSKFDPVNVSDPIPLPDVNYDGIAFHRAKVFGYPLHKHRINPVYNGMNSPYQYTISLSTQSDTVLFNGYFTMNNTPYYFVYDLKSASYQAKAHRLRGYELPISATTTLLFANEDLVHTYDTSHENYTPANEFITENIFTALQSIYLPHLDQLNLNQNKAIIASEDLNYIDLYRKMIRLVLIESAIAHIKEKKFTTFKITSLNLTNPVGHKAFVQSYTNIRLQGALNFYKKDFVNSTIEIPEGSLDAKLFETVEFYYANGGEKQAFIEFSVGDGRQHEVPKKFKIESIKIVTAYNASTKETPVKVRRNKEVFFNKSGFLVKFNLYDYDPVYEFLFRHVGNEVSRAFESELVTQRT